MKVENIDYFSQNQKKVLFIGKPKVINNIIEFFHQFIFQLNPSLVTITS